jgi:hypothetical protein
MLHSRQIDSMFELLGAKENDITYNIATESRWNSLLQMLLASDLNLRSASGGLTAGLFIGGS